VQIKYIHLAGIELCKHTLLGEEEERTRPQNFTGLGLGRCANERVDRPTRNTTRTYLR